MARGGGWVGRGGGGVVRGSVMFFLFTYLNKNGGKNGDMVFEWRAVFGVVLYMLLQLPYYTIIYYIRYILYNSIVTILMIINKIDNRCIMNSAQI